MILMWLQTRGLLLISNGAEYEWGNTKLRILADTATLVGVLIVSIVAFYISAGPRFILKLCCPQRPLSLSCIDGSQPSNARAGAGGRRVGSSAEKKERRALCVTIST